MLFCFAVPARGSAQEMDAAEFIRWLVLPRPLYEVHSLREYISSLPQPGGLSMEADLRRVNEIYARALYFAEGNAAEALFVAAAATLPYRRFPARIPLIDAGIDVPVSTESEEMFSKRLRNLPGRLFADTPPSLDRDKLTHFFGSAYLQLKLNNPEIACGAGDLIEGFESLFKIEGFRDERDVRVNALGVRYARLLQRQIDVPPSLMFRLQDRFKHEH